MVELLKLSSRSYMEVVQQPRCLDLSRQHARRDVSSVGAATLQPKSVVVSAGTRGRREGGDREVVGGNITHLHLASSAAVDGSHLHQRRLRNH